MENSLLLVILIIKFLFFTCMEHPMKWVVLKVSFFVTR